MAQTDPSATTQTTGGRLLAALRRDTVGGVLLLLATVAALAMANSPLQDFYLTVRETTIGPEALHLNLSIEHWAADGMLAIFFFVVGLELKREFVLGELSKPSAAAVPIGAAVAGMIVPALVYLVVSQSTPDSGSGWAIPTATDIAFALAVLAVLGRGLPMALRVFMLTLAVVDDLLAIIVIATFYTDSLSLLPLLGTVLLLGLYAWLQKRRVTSALVYVPLALVAWALLHESGIHATIAGVALGLLTRCRHDAGEHESPAERVEHRVRPLAAAVAVPVFAFFSAGVPVDPEAISGLIGDGAAVGVVLGLVVGKGVGVLSGTYVMTRVLRCPLPGGMSWSDIIGVGILCGIGFTVSLLITELAFGDQPERIELVKAGVLLGSLIATIIAGVILSRRRGYHSRMAAQQGTATRSPSASS